MTFAAALKAACLASATALGDDIKKMSWLMRNQDRKDHVEALPKKVA